MFMLVPPAFGQVRNWLLLQRQRDFSYAQVGATQGAIPQGYVVDRNRVHLGNGEQIYQRARRALWHWDMFALPWMGICFPDSDIPAPAEGQVLGLLARLPGAWSLNVCRIIYTFDNPRSCGFAYGTLPDHVARGEECFSVTWQDNDQVWFEILAFSQPRHPLMILGYPLARQIQKRFPPAAMQAMQQAIAAI